MGKRINYKIQTTVYVNIPYVTFLNISIDTKHPRYLSESECKVVMSYDTLITWLKDNRKKESENDCVYGYLKTLRDDLLKENKEIDTILFKTRR